MCVILYKPKGVDIPPMAIFDKMERLNHDGFGICTANKRIKTLDYERFKTAVQCVRKDEVALIHFRLATNGSVCRRNCHPFYDVPTGTNFMHNGVLALPHDFISAGDITDSEWAFKTYLVPAIRDYGIYSGRFAREVENVIGSSRFAFLQGDKAALFGRFSPYLGCWYSNLRFL